MAAHCKKILCATLELLYLLSILELLNGTGWKLKLLKNTIDEQKSKFLAEKFGQLFIKNGKKSGTKGRFSVVCNIKVLQLTATQCT